MARNPSIEPINSTKGYLYQYSVQWHPNELSKLGKSSLIQRKMSTESRNKWLKIYGYRRIRLIKTSRLDLVKIVNRVNVGIEAQLIYPPVEADAFVAIHFS